MKTFEYVLQTEEGIHARPATKLAQEAAKYNECKIVASHDGVEVNATDVLSLFKLRANKGDAILFIIEGENAADEEKAAQALQAFCKEIL